MPVACALTIVDTLPGDHHILEFMNEQPGRFNIDIADVARDEGMGACAYTDQAIFDLEMERIFRRAWIFVGHESQVRKPGDFRRTRMGVDEVLLVRQQDGSLRVLSNACTHRGTRLCAASSGSTISFVCPYHAWAFGLDGRLKFVPDVQSYPASFDTTDPALGLKSAPRVESYRRFVFASFAPEGPALTDFLGPMTDAIDNLVDRAPGGEIEIAGGSFRVRYPGNWKLHHENANDTVHPSFVHESSVSTANKSKIDPDPSLIDRGQTKGMMASNGLTPKDWNAIELNGMAQGHSFMGGFYKAGLLSRQTEDDVMRAYREALEAAHGVQKAADILGMDRFNNLVWPTLNVNAQFHQIRVVHPVSVNETILEGYCFRLAGAPDEIFHRAVRFLGALVSPASMIFSDDLEIFGRVQRGLESGVLPRLDSRRGIEKDAPVGDTRSYRSTTSSELPIRSQLKAWREWMMAQ
jgi:phenylpropionate dioxygenase-like ring-hydroxylating dioxygenase large terminal subunit